MTIRYRTIAPSGESKEHDYADQAADQVEATGGWVEMDPARFNFFRTEANKRGTVEFYEPARGSANMLAFEYTGPRRESNVAVARDLITAAAEQQGPRHGALGRFKTQGRDQ